MAFDLGIADEQAVASIRRRMFLTIWIQTIIITTAGILIMVLPPCLLPPGSVPLSLYFIGGALFFTLFLGSTGAHKVRTLQPTDIIQLVPPDHPVDEPVIPSKDFKEARKFPMLFAFRSYNYGMIGLLAASLISVLSEVPRDILQGRVAMIKWPLIAFGVGFVLQLACIISNAIAADNYAKELRPEIRDFATFEEMVRRRQREQAGVGEPVKFESLPRLTVPSESPDDTLQVILRNN
ncbi:uncharacterized protein LOC129587981 [Paramacrobiotus metropolitanus]|uniref:uncharacterized protein LOC129587981 n=1 Tax=Paramacrobiotus metropolitanus TaxID=2943436 RepID=UPI002445A3D2|nr:uncharacterized protein LOC129587981 [Paramacrobiotus metropolitanus]